MNLYKKQNTSSIFSISRFFIFFLLICFVVSCSLLLFLKDVQIDDTQVRTNAPLTFFNILFVTLLFTLADGIRRKLTVERPINNILAASDEVMAGNFNVSIPIDHQSFSGNEFVPIMERFNEMVKELQGMETLRTDFIANVSHELKTPLAIIQNYATILQDPTVEEEKRMESAKAITNATRKFSQLITNILKLNKLENQQIFPDAKRLNLSEQVRNCILDFEEEWSQKEIELAIDMEEIEIVADAELLTLVWNNLLSNAIKFSPENSKLSVQVKQINPWILVIIKDEGCGIDPSVGAHIFEKFFQGDTSHATSGNGLGLALVKRVIDIMKGEIAVESEVGKGSTFTVRIPKKDEYHSS